MPFYLSPASSYPEQYAWVDAGGAAHALDDTTGYQVEWGVRGRWSPGVRWVEDEVPYIAGTVLRDVNVEPLDWLLPLHISGDTPTQLHERIRALMYWMEPSRGDGYFRNTAADGETRLLACRVAEIAFVEESPSYRKAVVSLHAADPYWYADEDETATWDQDFGLPSPVFPVTFPWLFPANVLFSATTVDNPGQVKAWPTWTIQGPGTNPMLRNVTTGEVMTFSRTLGLGEMIVVEVSRDGATITDGLGTRLYSALSNPSTVWGLQPGINNVQVGMSDATSDSSVTLTYRPRFLGP